MNKLDRLILQGHNPNELVTRLSYDRLRWAAILSIVILSIGMAFELYITLALEQRNCEAFTNERISTRAAYELLSETAMADGAKHTAARLQDLSKLIQLPSCQGVSP